MKKIIWIELIIIFLGVLLHIIPFLYNRALWVDEAYIASTLCTRDLSNLTSTAMDFGQSAPIGWLYIVKSIISIFGNSEVFLRITSLFAFFGCIFVIYFLLKDKVSKVLNLGAIAFICLIDKFIYYSNELKPYMFDNFICLLVLLIYQKYKENKIKLIYVVLIYSVLIWFSFISVFFIAACMILICLNLLKSLLKNKEKSKMVKQILLCSLVLVSFIFNYVFWLSNTSDGAGEKEYWDLLKFPIIINSFKDISLIKLMIMQFFNVFPRIVAYIIVVLIGIYLFNVFNNKKDNSKLLLSVMLSLVLLLIASALGFYPIQDRLIQIYPMLFVIFAVFGCNEIEIKSKEKKGDIYFFYYMVIIGCFVSVALIGSKNLQKNYVYKNGAEVKENINYLKENLKEEDVVYVNRFGISSYLYENNYPTSAEELTNLPCEKQKVIYGSVLVDFKYKEPYNYDFEPNIQKVKENAQLILNYNSVYLFVSQSTAGINELLEELRQYGNVKLINNSYGTFLFHFEKIER